MLNYGHHFARTAKMDPLSRAMMCVARAFLFIVSLFVMHIQSYGQLFSSSREVAVTK